MLNHDLVDGLLDRLELALQFSMFTSSNTGCDDGSGDVACPPESSFGLDEDVWDVLLFADQGEVEKDLQRFGVSREDNDLRNATI